MGKFLAFIVLFAAAAGAVMVVGNPSTVPAARVVQMQQLAAPAADVVDEAPGAVLPADGGRRRTSSVVKACQDGVCLPDVMDVGAFLRSAPRG